MLKVQAFVVLNLLVVAGMAQHIHNYTEVDPTVPDRLGEPCLEACGSGGWCAWCGIRKACCQAGNGAKDGEKQEKYRDFERN
eukprot:g11647.t1